VGRVDGRRGEPHLGVGRAPAPGGLFLDDGRVPRALRDPESAAARVLVGLPSPVGAPQPADGGAGVPFVPEGVREEGRCDEARVLEGALAGENDAIQLPVGRRSPFVCLLCPTVCCFAQKSALDQHREECHMVYKKNSAELKAFEESCSAFWEV
jgi:hypothetical protein